MISMLSVNATDIRKNWSTACDMVARVRPSFIKRTHDSLVLSSREDMLKLLAGVKVSYSISKEDSGTYTIALKDIDLAENSDTKEGAIDAMAASILEYAEEFYEEYELYSKAPNRASHLPMVMKALLLGDVRTIKEEMLCQSGRI